MTTLSTPIADGRFNVGARANSRYSALHGSTLDQEALDTLGVAGQPMVISSMAGGPTGPGAAYEWADGHTDGSWHKVQGSDPPQYTVRPGR
jgi:hypothetical protein